MNTNTNRKNGVVQDRVFRSVGVGVCKFLAIVNCRTISRTVRICIFLTNYDISNFANRRTWFPCQGDFVANSFTTYCRNLVGREFLQALIKFIGVGNKLCELHCDCKRFITGRVSHNSQLAFYFFQNCCNFACNRRVYTKTISFCLVDFSLSSIHFLVLNILHDCCDSVCRLFTFVLNGFFKAQHISVIGPICFCFFYKTFSFFQCLFRIFLFCLVQQLNSFIHLREVKATLGTDFSRVVVFSRTGRARNNKRFSAFYTVCSASGVFCATQTTHDFILGQCVAHVFTVVVDIYRSIRNADMILANCNIDQAFFHLGFNSLLIT